jgi:uncharacterized protein YjbI with pentapeptide repeats
MDPQLTKEVWKALVHGTSLASLGLPFVGERIDLRGLAAPELSVVGEVSIAEAHLRRLANLTQIRGVRWSDIDFSGADLQSLRLFDCTLENCSFEGAICRDWRLWGTSVEDCSFRSANLRDAALGGTNERRRNSYRRIDFTKADLRGTAHESADVIGCTFADTNLKKVDFQATVFVDCSFAGELNDVAFARFAFRGESFPPNQMTGADFRCAKLRYTWFRNLDLEDVHWPEDADHIVVSNYKLVLDRMLDLLRNRNDSAAKGLTGLLEHARQWVGPKQDRGVFNRLDLIDSGDGLLAQQLLKICEQPVT